MDIICKQAPDILSITETKVVIKDEKVIICTVCQQPITDPSKQIIVNQSFRHIFANPYGHVFEIGCFSDAMGCRAASISSTEFSWFIGYSWQIGVCAQCSTHLGWFFSSAQNSFWGLILERLLFP